MEGWFPYSLGLTGLRPGGVLVETVASVMNLNGPIFGFLDKPSFTHNSYTRHRGQQGSRASADSCPCVWVSRPLHSGCLPRILVQLLRQQIIIHSKGFLSMI